MADQKSIYDGLEQQAIDLPPPSGFEMKVQFSAAVSLKRIADALEKTARVQEETNLRISEALTIDEDDDGGTRQ